MNLTSQRLCAWAGLLVVPMLLIGLGPAAGFLPPPPPTDTADQVAAIYRERATGIRIATLLILFSGAFYAAITAAITVQMRRMEHRVTPVLTMLQLICGATVVVLFIAVAVSWAAAAFRPERDPQLVMLLNDLGWFWFLMTVSTPALQNIALGCAILGDRSATPVMPRWLGFFVLWIAVLFTPGAMLIFFKTGPFAWDGLLAFWVPLFAFGGWFLVMGVQLLKAIGRQAADA
jgi:hypothetical protein